MEGGLQPTDAILSNTAPRNDASCADRPAPPIDGPPPDDFDFPVRWRTIKALFSRSVPPAEARRASLVRKREAGVWQRRYWEHTIRDDQDYAAHMDDIHFNPVKHGHARHPADWPFSSFARCVTRGLYPIEWAIEGAGLADTGERP